MGPPPGASPPMRMTASWSGSNHPTAYKSVARRCAPMASSPRIPQQTDRQPPTRPPKLCKKPCRSSSSRRVLGLTQREYCERHGLSLKSFGNWRGQLTREDVAGGDARWGRHPRLRHMVSPMATPMGLEVPTPQRSDRFSLNATGAVPSRVLPNDLGSRQNRASPAHNKPCQKWTLTELP